MGTSGLTALGGKEASPQSAPVRSERGERGKKGEREEKKEKEKTKSGKKRNIRRGKYAHEVEDSRLRGDRYPSPKRLVPACEHTFWGDRYPSPEYAHMQARVEGERRP